MAKIRCLAFTYSIFFFLSDIVSASRILFRLISLQSMRLAALRRNYLSVASRFFWSCFEFAEAPYPCIKMGSIKHTMSFLLFWIEVYLFVIADVIRLRNSWCDFSVGSIVCYLSTQEFELIPLFEFIPFDWDVDLWTLIVSTITSIFLLFNSNPFSLLSSSTKSSNHCKFPLFPAINTV